VPLMLGKWRWFTFSFVAGLDAALVFVVASLIALTSWLDRRARARAERLREGLDRELSWLYEVLGQHHAAASRDQLRALGEVLTSSIGDFSGAAQGALGALESGARQFGELLASRQREEAAMSAFAETLQASVSGLLTYADQVQALYERQYRTVDQIEAALTTLFAEQKAGRRALEGISSSVTRVAQALQDTGARIREGTASLTTGGERVTAAAEAIAGLSGQLTSTLAAVEGIYDTLRRLTDAQAGVAEGLRQQLDATTNRSDALLEDLGSALADLAVTTRMMRDVDERTTSVLPRVTRELEHSITAAARELVGATQFTQGRAELIDTRVLELVQGSQQLTSGVDRLQNELEALLQRATRTMTWAEDSLTQVRGQNDRLVDSLDQLSTRSGELTTAFAAAARAAPRGAATGARDTTGATRPGEPRQPVTVPAPRPPKRWWHVF
jgi:chromosome segregation ATPase